MQTTTLEGHLPTAFCWTRMGEEAGQELDRILRRKELERQGTGGQFVWGIGNGVRPGLDRLLARGDAPRVLFSPIRSAAAVIDREPSGVLLWLRYVDLAGQMCDLPGASFVTSRSETSSGAPKRSHYALFCRSAAPLVSGDRGTIYFDLLRNIGTTNRVGFSQVTAVVERANEGLSTDLSYRVALSADLTAPYSARLASPVQLLPNELELIESVIESNDKFLWIEAVRSIKERAFSVDLNSASQMNRK
jgi:hypothetical protein